MQKRRLARLSILPLPDPTPGVATEFQIILTFRFHHQHTCISIISIIIIIRTPGWMALAHHPHCEEHSGLFAGHIIYTGIIQSYTQLFTVVYLQRIVGYNIRSHHIITVLHSWAWFYTVAGGLTVWIVQWCYTVQDEWSYTAVLLTLDTLVIYSSVLHSWAWCYTVAGGLYAGASMYRS